MSKELNKAVDNLQWIDPYYADWRPEIAFRYGWESARDKIIEILRNNASKEDRAGASGKYLEECLFIYDLDKILSEIESL